MNEIKLIGFTLMALASTGFAQTPAASGGQPNIVYILADDLGYGDVHCLNPERGKIATPQMDRMAAQGMIFTDAHSSSSVCTPTRYGILTGRYNWRSTLQKGVLHGYSSPLIAADRLTVPALLKQHGYTTACIGKWHLGMGIEKGQLSPKITDGPTTRGFDSYFGISASLDMPPYAYIDNDHFTEPLTTTKTFSRKGPGAASFEAVDVLPTLTAKAVGFIATQAKTGKPFFLYLPLPSPHTPIVPSQEWQGKSDLGKYGDYVMETDWSVGQVVAAIEQAGIGTNTLVILTSDNGCSKAAGITALEAKGHYPSAQFRGSKSDIWDGGHRIPFIALWPGTIKPGSPADQIQSRTVLRATCAELGGAILPANAGEDSFSFLPILKGTGPGARESVVHHSIQGKFAIRQGPWKLEFCPGSGGWSSPNDAEAIKEGLPPWQLYNVSTDMGEQRNLQAENPEMASRLKELLVEQVANGRSTFGPKEKNDVTVNIFKNGEKK